VKTSINFKVVKSDSETHNFRKKTFDYIRKDLTPKNEYWMEQKIADRIQKIEAYCKEKSGRKLQKNAMPIREAVVVIKEDTTMLELQNLAKRLEEELSIRVFQIAIHKDEGHTDKDTKEWKPNHHAHLVADWQDLNTGKTLKHQSFHYSKMQDLTAECLNMERGISGSRGRLEAIEFKIQQKEEDLKVLEERYDTMKSEMGSKKSEELVVKENDFLGFKKIKTDKTIENYEKAFRTYKSTILKNKKELESKSKQITELNTKVDDLKKQVHLSKNKNAVLLSNPTVFASEKKKYLDSVINIVEREIKFSRFRNPHLDRTDKQKLISEMEKIAQKISQENTVPFSAFNEIFKDTGMTNQLFSLLQFGNNSTNYEAEDIPIQNKRKRKRL
jgi:CII-binding regulator of phage lambda lysogenization HflD